MTTRKKLSNHSIFQIKLKQLFKESKHTHAELAVFITNKTSRTLTRQAVGGWVLGKAAPRLDTLPIIAEFFGVTTDFLLTPTAKRTSEISGYSYLSEAALSNINRLAAAGVDINAFIERKDLRSLIEIAEIIDKREGRECK